MEKHNIIFHLMAYRFLRLHERQFLMARVQRPFGFSE